MCGWKGARPAAQPSAPREWPGARRDESLRAAVLRGKAACWATPISYASGFWAKTPRSHPRHGSGLEPGRLSFRANRAFPPPMRRMIAKEGPAQAGPSEGGFTGR